MTTKIKKKEYYELNKEKRLEYDKELLADIKTLGKDKFQRVIIDFCNTKKQLTYAEIYHQMAYRDW